MIERKTKEIKKEGRAKSYPKDSPSANNISLVFRKSWAVLFSINHFVHKVENSVLTAQDFLAINNDFCFQSLWSYSWRKQKSLHHQKDERISRREITNAFGWCINCYIITICLRFTSFRHQRCLQHTYLKHIVIMLFLISGGMFLCWGDLWSLRFITSLLLIRKNETWRHPQKHLENRPVH